jgi:hypothetical protein
LAPRHDDLTKYPVDNQLSVNLTALGALTVGSRHTVGRFYNTDSRAIPLTTDTGLRARINPVGMGIALIGANSLTRDHLFWVGRCKVGIIDVSRIKKPIAMRIYWIVFMANIAIFMTLPLVNAGA